jgi:hypothetical protein
LRRRRRCDSQIRSTMFRTQTPRVGCAEINCEINLMQSTSDLEQRYRPPFYSRTAKSTNSGDLILQVIHNEMRLSAQ